MTNGLIRIGLTGSIGMGKSTVAGMFRDLGLPIWNADEAVAELYAKDGGAVEAVASLAPEAVVGGAVDRQILSNAIKKTPDLLRKIEAVVHPLVAANRKSFERSNEGRAIVFEIPLLFETGQADSFDVTVVVSADADVQRARVLRRPGMTPEKLDLILGRQMPDAEKRLRADFVIRTDVPLEETRAIVRDVYAKIMEDGH